MEAREKEVQFTLSSDILPGLGLKDGEEVELGQTGSFCSLSPSSVPTFFVLLPVSLGPGLSFPFVKWGFQSLCGVTAFE